ncbi:MAG: guanylate kinase [Bacteroidales bacterium]|nr:guanylate kinase [Bacteroidales bacterium]
MSAISSLIISAPSGTGKTTILNRLFEIFPEKFSFSVSATTRKKREGEEDGKHYYFISEEEFKERILQGDFLEYENVYEGLFYGTLKSETERINSEGRIAVFDVDVKGGINIKTQLKDNAFALFIMPPSVEELKKRLVNRKTEDENSLQQRLLRAEMEISYAEKFDNVVVNDDLEKAVSECKKLIEEKFAL